MKVYDCFMFMNEIELLELRMDILCDVVDYFVVVEANKTHSGKARDFILEQHPDVLTNPKVIYVKVEDLPDPEGEDCWPVENYHRNCIMQGLGNANSEDRILISDVDEIPHPEAVHTASDMDIRVVFSLHLYYYYVNCIQTQIWLGPIMETFEKLTEPQLLRDYRNFCKYKVSPPFGWHFSFLGGKDRIKEKLSSYCENQTNTPIVNNDDNIIECLNTGKDLFGRVDPSPRKKFIDISEYPEAIHRFVKKYPYMYKELS